MIVDTIITTIVVIAICLVILIALLFVLKNIKNKVKIFISQIVPEELKRANTNTENDPDRPNRLYMEGMVYSQDLQTLKEAHLLKYHTPQRFDELTNLDLDLKIGLSDISINLALDGTTINPFEMQNVFPSKVSINPLVRIKINDEEVPNGGEFSVGRMHKDTKIKLQLFYKECKRTYFLNTVHSEMPKYRSTGESKIDGYIYTNVHNFKFILKMDKYGNAIFWRRTNQNSHDFKPTMIDGKLYYSYCDERNYDLHLHGNWSGESEFILMNERFEIIDRVKEIKRGIWPEYHEAVVLGIGHYIIPSYVLTYVNNIPGKEDEMSISLMAAVIHEIKDGEAKEIFNSTNHPELYHASYIRDTSRIEYNNHPAVWRYTTLDYMHLNTIVMRENNTKMLMNFRQQNASIYYDITNQKIDWILSGDLDDFGLEYEQKFWHAHYPRFHFSKHCKSQEEGTEDTLVLLDNGNNVKQTRVVEYRLDFKNKKLLEFKEYKITNRYSEAGACTQRIGEGHFTIGWGLFIGVHAPKYSEIDFNTNKIEFEWFLNHKDGTYRTVKYPY